jgi:hypothetical protein
MAGILDGPLGERYARCGYGRVQRQDIEAIVEDAGILTRPVTLGFTVLLIPNSDVLEQFCSEGDGIWLLSRARLRSSPIADISRPQQQEKQYSLFQPAFRLYR